jgi:hypothetical protein
LRHAPPRARAGSRRALTRIAACSLAQMRFTHEATGIRRLSLHRKRATLLGLGLSFEHYVFAVLYALALQQCLSTVGQPYAAAVAHAEAHKAALTAALGAVGDAASAAVESAADAVARFGDDEDGEKETPLPSQLLPAFWAMTLTVRGARAAARDARATRNTSSCSAPCSFLPPPRKPSHDATPRAHARARVSSLYPR